MIESFQYKKGISLEYMQEGSSHPYRGHCVPGCRDDYGGGIILGDCNKRVDGAAAVGGGEGGYTY